jgi:pimeloyl-ACP methyl ester carboxylesterase
MSHNRLIVHEHKIDVPNGWIFAREWLPEDAAGAALLLLHDSLGCVDVWRDFPAMLAAESKRRVIAYDRLGFGRSQARVGALSSSFVREESEVFIPHLLRSLRLDTFIPFGHSVGGGMAMYCGDTLRRSCAAIITVAAQMFAESKTLLAIAEAKQAYAQPERLARLEKYHGSKAPWVLQAWTETWLSDDFAKWSLRDTLPSIRCPILAIHGELDEFGSLEHPRMIEALAGGRRRTVILSGVGHLPHREQQLNVLQIATDFLKSV